MESNAVKTMPRAKKRKEKPRGASPSVVPVLQKFLKTYQKYCVQSGTSLCPTIQRDLKNSIDREQILRKVSGDPSLGFSPKLTLHQLGTARWSDGVTSDGVTYSALLTGNRGPGHSPAPSPKPRTCPSLTARMCLSGDSGVPL